MDLVKSKSDFRNEDNEQFMEPMMAVNIDLHSPTNHLISPVYLLIYRHVLHDLILNHLEGSTYISKTAPWPAVFAGRSARHRDSTESPGRPAPPRRRPSGGALPPRPEAPRRRRSAARRRDRSPRAVWVGRCLGVWRGSGVTSEHKF